MSGLHIRRHATFKNLYAVFREETRVSSWQLIDFTTNRMERMVEREQGGQRMRKCLCCGVEFVSEGPHNRLCRHHRATIGGLGREMVD